MIRKNTDPDPEPSQDGVLRGLISSQFPNVLEKAPYPMAPRAGLDREIERLRIFFGNARLQAQDEMDMVRFYTYAHLANKRISTFRLSGESEVLLPYMCGPLVTYYLGKSRGLSDAMRPKGEVFDLVEELTGYPYSVLSKSKASGKAKVDKPKSDFGRRIIGKIRREFGKLSGWHGASEKRDRKDNLETSKNRGALVVEYKHFLRTEGSKVLKTVRNDKILNYLSNIYDETSEQSDVLSTKFKQSSESRALQIINLELIIERAEALETAKGSLSD